MVSHGNLMSKIINSNIQATDTVGKALYTQFTKINEDTTLGRVSRILEKDPFVLVIRKQANGGKLNFVSTGYP